MISFFITIGRFIRAIGVGLKDKEFRALFIFVLLLILSGTFFYWQTEHWSLLDSLYFCITTLTTVGSKLQPETVFGKIFTIIYILVGLGSMAALITAIAHHSKEQHPDISQISERFLKKK